MTARVDEKISRCLMLLNAQEFQPLLEFLQEQQTDTLTRLCASRDKDEMLRLQGRANQAKDFLDLVSNGSTLLTKTRRQ